jgi:hypothetical protein
VNALSTLMSQVKADTMMPQGQFFHPTEAYWTALKDLQEEHGMTGWVEVGAGNGKVAKAAWDKGIRVLALDIAERADQWEDVVLMDAIVFPYTTDIWPIACRPSHDGWFYDVLERCDRRNVSAVYVGLPRNLNRDIGRFNQRITKIVRKVGEAGESLYVIDNANRKSN